MNILVTGGAGFIGGHLVERLLAEKHRVTVIDDLSLGRESNLPTSPMLHFQQGDVNDPKFLEEVFSQAQPECVFHLAANSDIGAGGHDLSVDFNRTFSTSISVLQAMKKYGCKQLVFASTSAIYGELPDVITEKSGPLRPISHYGAAKLASEAFISATAHIEGIQTWIFRFPNVCGPRATHGVFYNFLKFLQADPTKITIAQDGKQAKPYIYVLDLIEAIMVGWKTAKDSYNTFNVGNTPLVSVNEILDFLLEELGIKEIQRNYTLEPAWPGDVTTYIYDDSKIRALGYTPRFNSTEAARQTAHDLVAAAQQHPA